MTSGLQKGIWSEIKPKGRRKTEWRFGSYWAIQEDGRWYTAFHFRNEERTKFGIREWIGKPGDHRLDLRRMAMRVITDEAFRKSLLSDRADLRDWWRKR
jgi:hypothetical protein